MTQPTRDERYRSLIAAAPHDETCPGSPLLNGGHRWPTLLCCHAAMAYREAHWPTTASDVVGIAPEAAA